MTQLKIRKALTCAILALAFFQSRGAWAVTERWVPLTNVPWTKITAYTMFKGNMIVAGPEAGTVTNSCWFSGDETTWEKSNSPPPFVNFFEQHSGYIFAFSYYYYYDGQVQQHSSVYRSSDGRSWETVTSGLPGLTDWQSMVSFAGFLYGITSTDIWSTSGDGAAPVWTRVSGLPWGTNFLNGFGILNGNLYAVTTIQSGGSVFYRSSDGIQWNQVFQSTESSPLGRPCVYNGSIYVATVQSIFKSDGLGDGSTWTSVTSDANSPPLAAELFIAFNRLHFSSYNREVTFVLQPLDGTFASVNINHNVLFTTIFGGDNGVLPNVADRVYLVDSTLGLTGMTRGIVDVTAEPLSSPSLIAGQTNQAVLGWSARVNLDETLTSLTVQNLGTARDKTDLSAVHLTRAVTSGSTISLHLLTDLTPGADGRSWSTPSGFSASVEEGDKLYVTVDVKIDATNKSTCRFFVPSDGYRWTQSQSFSLPNGLVSPQEQTISSDPSLGTINGILIFPQPAGNALHFMYDLDAISDVSIKIFNLRGQLVSEIHEEAKAAGRKAETVWDSSGKAPDVYFAQIEITPAVGEVRRYKKRVYIQR